MPANGTLGMRATSLKTRALTSTKAGSAVRAGDWKLIEFYDENKHELYNLKSDIGEKTDLAKKHPAKAKQLLDMLHNWQKEIGAKLPTPNPDYKQ